MSAPTRAAASSASDLDVFACPLDGLRLIEASAGTGKTWNICGLYLRLLLEKSLAAPQILVVTFTNAAAAELRERIRSRIVDVASYLQNAAVSADTFVDSLVAAVEANAGIDREQMRTLLDVALHTFDEAAVFTIHGFCQRALADTPFAAGLPFHLDLLHDDEPLRLEAVSDFWRRHIASGNMPPALADHLAQNGDCPDAWARLLGRQLAKPRSRVLWPGELESAAAAIETIRLTSAFEHARELWGCDGAEATAALYSGLGALNATSYKEDGVKSAARAWTDWLTRGDAFSAPNSESGKVQLFSASFIAGKTKKKQLPPEHPFFTAAEELLAQLASLTQLLQTERLRLLRRMFAEAGAALRDKKRKSRVISFDDMLSNVDSALRSPATPWLASYLRSRYPVALIDEFQDTDPLQYAIFSRIYGTGDRQPKGSRSVVGEQPTGSRGIGPLFLVGDPKQAIYSFRNADLHTYLAARREAGTPYTLRHNQRSSAGLIAACNALFSANPASFILPGLDYEAVTVGDKPRKLLHDVSDTDNGDETAAALRIWRLPDDDGKYLARGEAKRAVLRATAGEVSRLLRAAQVGTINLGERPLAPRDLAILVKSHAQGRLLREALLQVGVGSVELSQHSIFHTHDAEELERVLLAILKPARQSFLYSALASEVMGFDANAIAALASDKNALLQTMARFGGYRDLWLRRGFSVMLRAWIEDERVALRLLARSDGERRFTNLLHLGEMLQEASAEHPAPDELLRWLASKRRDEGDDEVAQLRLESDRNLVQIVTIYKSKGLEYAIVFCPFLWDGHQSNFGASEGSEYHDDNNKPVIDFRFAGDSLAATEVDEIKRRRREEKDAEYMRLVYVALTRAAQRCYLVAGCYATFAFGRSSLTQGNRSLLNWLVAGKDMPYAEWLTHKLSSVAIEAAWRELAAAASPHLSLIALPDATPLPLARPTLQAEKLSVLTPPAKIAPAWRIGSFSSLQNGTENEGTASDYGGGHPALTSTPVRSVAPSSGVADTPTTDAIAADDIVNFPRGPAAGDCIHALFEHIDFTNPERWPAAIEQALAAHPQVLPGVTATESASTLACMLRRLLDDVLATELPGPAVLATVPQRQRLVELGFNVPAERITSARVSDWLAAHGYAVPRLAFQPLSGYLKGFIDLVFCAANRYYVLDWKSNHLGDTQADYGQQRLAQAMAAHGYHLQALIYCVALHRYLRLRIADYDYERDFGGVHYLFIRGVRPDWKDADGSACGVYHHRPPQSTITALDAMLAGASPAVMQ